jgi:hypothetical protein
LPRDGGLDPELGIDLEYFVDEQGFAKATARMPGDGPTWITALASLRDGDAAPRMFAAYVKVKPPLEVYARGLAEFDDQAQEFRQIAQFDMESPLFPEGHTLVEPGQGEQGRHDYLYFANPFPLVRVRATPEHVRDLSKYETYSCLAEGSRGDSVEVVRSNGAPSFRWIGDTIPYTQAMETKLIQSGQLKPSEAILQLRGPDGKPIAMHRGSVNWNEYRQRWIMIGVESFGSSLLGEVWYAEAEQLVGPWTAARKIVTHDKYSFYNPKQHPMLDQDGGRVIFFEGTYTNTFSGNDRPTPRYNYNQILYKLDLSDPRLH